MNRTPNVCSALTPTYNKHPNLNNKLDFRKKSSSLTHKTVTTHTKKKYEYLIYMHISLKFVQNNQHTQIEEATKKNGIIFFKSNYTGTQPIHTPLTCTNSTLTLIKVP